MASRILQARIDGDLKSKAEEILMNLGMRPADAIRLFYARIVIENGLPFRMRLPQDDGRGDFDPVEYIKGIEED